MRKAIHRGRVLSALHLVHYDDHDPNAAVDYGLSLQDIALDSLLVNVGPGLEWAFADKMSVAINPRFQILLGQDAALAATIPVVFTMSWYL